jgi:hypothetical protein
LIEGARASITGVASPATPTPWRLNEAAKGARVEPSLAEIVVAVAPRLDVAPAIGEMANEATRRAATPIKNNPPKTLERPLNLAPDNFPDRNSWFPRM